MTFQQCIDRLRDGRAYVFTNPGLKGYFYKAPSYPEDIRQTEFDGESSAITYYNKATNEPMMPTLRMYDFDDKNWTIHRVSQHPRDIIIIRDGVVG
jgi:hypothetical protein